MGVWDNVNQYDVMKRHEEIKIAKFVYLGLYLLEQLMFEGLGVQHGAKISRYFNLTIGGMCA